MKHRDLTRRLRRIGRDHGVQLEFVCEGANHEVWSVAGRTLVILRHREINEHTARAIIEQVEEVLSDDE